MSSARANMIDIQMKDVVLEVKQPADLVNSHTHSDNKSEFIYKCITYYSTFFSSLCIVNRRSAVRAIFRFSISNTASMRYGGKAWNIVRIMRHSLWLTWWRKCVYEPLNVGFRSRHLRTITFILSRSLMFRPFHVQNGLRSFDTVSCRFYVAILNFVHSFYLVRC